MNDADGDHGEARATSQRQPDAAARLRPRGAGNATAQPSEEELWSGTYSGKAMVGPGVGLGVLTIAGLIASSFAGPFGWGIAGAAAVILWAIFGLLLVYRKLSVRYRLTSFRFFHETGLLNRTRNRIEVIDINDVTLQQRVIERMFNVGTIHIQSSDVTHPDIFLPGIEDVHRVTDLIDNTRRAERQRRGVFMENIGGAPQV